MADTKENILMAALRLFAKDGYEAVSVSAIAGEIGITKGALYRHYKNKRDIFDSIIMRMKQMDYENAKQYDVPDDTFEKMPQVYRNTTIDNIMAFGQSQFKYWTQDEFATSFRKMLTLEQYRNKEMNSLYQRYLSGGPISYTEDLFRVMMVQGIIKEDDPKQLALELFAPMYLLMNISDTVEDKNSIVQMVEAHIKRFMIKYKN